MRLCQTEKCPGFRQGMGRTACSLEQIPQELVVDFVVKLHFLSLYKGPKKAGAAVGGALFQLGVSGFYVFSEQRSRPIGFLEIV